MPLLAVRGATVAATHAHERACTDGARASSRLCVAERVSFQVHRGQRCVIAGPPGVGKSTFLLAVRGLLPLSKGSVTWAPDVRALHVPQGVVLAPTRSLARQLMYPDDGECSAQEAESLLHAVGLGHLWEQHGADCSSSNGLLAPQSSSTTGRS